MARLSAGIRKNIPPDTAPRCRYYPSRSNYAIQAIEPFGCLKGGFFPLLRFFV
ncbi:MAG: membrane protein insertion efficiency factor YidD [Bifidobacterium adolescentis]